MYIYCQQSLGGKDKSFFAFDSNDAKSYELFLLDNVKGKSSISHYLRTFYKVMPVIFSLFYFHSMIPEENQIAHS